MLTTSNTDDINKEDTTKILNEINQIINQRFQLTISAITVFGVFIAWTIPKDLDSDKPANEFLFTAPILLLIFLFFLFLYSHHLNRMISTLSTYLRVTKKSKWEDDFVKFRGNKGVGYSLIEYIIFLALGVITSSFPFILCSVSRLGYPTSPGGQYVLIVIGCAYVIFVVGVSFFKWWNNEEKARKKWEVLLINEISNE